MPFNPLDCLAIHFETIAIWFLYILGFRSINDTLFILRILHWQTTWSKCLKEGHAYIKQFGVSCSTICSTNHCFQSVVRISITLCTQNSPVALWVGDLSLSKVYDGSLGYAEGSPFTLYNHFIQPYKALDTVFEYY